MTAPWRGQYAEARYALAKRCPYWMAGLLALRPAECLGLGTVGVTAAGVLMCDPERIAEWYANGTLPWVLAHELTHILLDHAGRCEDRDPALWNIAGDCAINPGILAMPGKLPDGAVVPATLRCPERLTAEQIYEWLQHHPLPASPGGGGGGKGGAGPSMPGTLPSLPGSGRPRMSRKVGAGQPMTPEPTCGQIVPGTGDPWKPECGTGAGGKPLPGEAEAEAQVGGGQSDASVKRMRHETAQAVQEHIRSHGQGSVPADLAVWAGRELAPPKIPWRTQLRRAVRRAVKWRAGQVDYTYRQPSRRQGAIGYGPGRPVLRGLHAPVPRVACVVDTSGSMGTTQLDAALAEVAGVVKATGGEVVVLDADAAVQGRHTARRASDVRKIEFAGGGGTDFRPALKALAEDRPGYDAVVYLTDGHGSFPKEEPTKFHVIWVLTPSGQRPPWGTVIELEANEAVR